MHRNAKIREFDLNYDSYLPKNESLLLQLCEHIFRSGFVFQDSNTNEIEAGEWVIRDFFDQQAEVFFELVARDRLNSFISYLDNFDLSLEQLKKKLWQRIIKAFDQLSIGKHHHYNIRQNISQGLNKKCNHPLYDLLMYIETYYNQVLVNDLNQQEYHVKNPNLKTSQFQIEDLKRLRNMIQNQLIGRELVKRFLKNIAKERGCSYEDLVQDEIKKERQYPAITFIQPSDPSLQNKKKNKSKKLAKTNEFKNKSEVVKLSFKPIIENDKKNVKDPFSLDLVRPFLENEESRNIEDKKHNKIELNNEKSELFIPSKDNSLEGELGDLDKDDNINDDEDDVFNKTIYSANYDSDVVFGNKNITPTSMKNFVKEYPDSALKFIFRKNLDGKPLLGEIKTIYVKWEQRGLLKEDLKKYVLELTKWSEFPDSPSNNLLQTLREKIYEVTKNNGE